MLRRLKYDSCYTAGNDVHFKMLKFPYKILEDVYRNFQIQQQPSSQENVNNLINSTGFYFNNDVEIEVEKTRQGLKGFTACNLRNMSAFYLAFPINRQSQGRL